MSKLIYAVVFFSSFGGQIYKFVLGYKQMNHVLAQNFNLTRLGSI
tara:strand:+ start:464 stop:598 length:135 start_codon:yes stop_codon:yes gene_type:complete